MSAKPAIQCLSDELRAVIDKYADNCAISYAEAIGVLQMLQFDIYQTAASDEEGEESE